MATFLEELQDHVRIFNRELLALEQDPSGDSAAESIKILFRSAHSLKGAARSVQATRLEGLCHRLEEMLAAIRDGKRALDAEAFAQLFAAVDEFGVAGRELASPPKKSGPAPAPVRRDAIASGPVAVQSPPPPKEKEATPVPTPAAPAASESAAVPLPAATPPLLPAPPAQAAPPTLEPAVAPPPRAPASPVRPASGRVPAPGAAAKSPGDGAVVRVPRRRLDALLAQSGELLVARRRFDVRQHEMRALQELVAAWRAEWRLSEQALKRWKRQQKTGAAHNGMPSRIERFLRGSGPQLNRLERELDRLALGLAEDRRTLERAAMPLQEQIHEARMVPFTEACEGLFRAVRDLAATEGKEAMLRIEAGDTELDRSIVDGLRDPLLHLIRNAVAHGLEPASERETRGKPRTGSIVVRAALRGDAVEVSVSDDGRGVDLEAIRGRALQRGLGVPSDDRELLRLIFEPGFSTAREVSEVAGRGVGLDVVKSQVDAMRGAVSLTFEPGAGSCFTLSLPLTLTTLRVLLVRAGGEVFAVPSTSVRTMVRGGTDNMGAMAGRDVLLLGEAPIPVASLAPTLGLPGTASTRGQNKIPLLVLSADERSVAIAVDELLSEQDVVLKAFGPRIGRPRFFSGATLLGSGQIALVLKPVELARAALGRGSALEWAKQLADGPLRESKRLLLVDDSVTTRTLEKSILEAAGHIVTTASDGQMAWQILQEQGADLVVSDVEMPNMDGFTLTETIRNSKRFKDLPVILITALQSEQDRARGLALGADAYLLKTSFDQKQLLDTIRQLL